MLVRESTDKASPLALERLKETAGEIGKAVVLRKSSGL